MIINQKNHLRSPIIMSMYNKIMMKFNLTFILFLLFVTSQTQLLLNNIPLFFELAGTTNYKPSSGGHNIQGYILRLGYTRHQWIGVKFMTLTSNNNYDILIFKRSTTSNAGLYKCTVSDYYVSSEKQSLLVSDSITSMDQQVIMQSDSNHFSLQMVRTIANTNGEDWQGGEFVKICFFTSDSIFNKDTWITQYQTCYGFVVDDYVSTSLGYQIIPYALIDGVESMIYGGFSGPLLKLQLYVYRMQKNFTANQIIIKIGEIINQHIGYDFHKCLINKGDYFGNVSDSLKSDLICSGYNDGKCQLTKGQNYSLLHFSRVANTFDELDNIISHKTNFCFIVGLNENCYYIQPKFLFPKMNIEPTIKLSAQNILLCLIINLILILLIF